MGRGRRTIRRRTLRRRMRGTLDGGSRGELEIELLGGRDHRHLPRVQPHPGYAKGRMINAVRIAGEFLAALPTDRLSPGTTGGYRGLSAHAVVDAAVDRTPSSCSSGTCREPKEEERLVENLARAVVARHRCSARDRDVEVLPEHAGCSTVSPDVVERATGAIRLAGLEVRMRPIHGGRMAPPVVHGPPDAEPVCRRAQLPLAARVGVGSRTWTRRWRSSNWCRLWHGQCLVPEVPGAWCARVPGAWWVPGAWRTPRGILARHLAPLAGLEIAELQAAERDPFQARDLVANRLEHPADFPVLSFGQFDDKVRLAR